MPKAKPLIILILYSTRFFTNLLHIFSPYCVFVREPITAIPISFKISTLPSTYKREGGLLISLNLSG